MDKKITDPAWWRTTGRGPYVVLVLAAAAADFCFPVWQSAGVTSPGIGAGIGGILLVAAILLLRRDMTRREQIFLVLLSIISFAGLLVSGSGICRLAFWTLPFLVILFGPGRAIPTEPGTDYRNWWEFWIDRRHLLNSGRWIRILPVLLSGLIGVVCFVVFMGIFASGNPVVQMVWESLADTWCRVMGWLKIDADAWAHVAIWIAGVFGFALYTVPRPPDDVFRFQDEDEEPAVAGRRLLPHLPLMVLLGVNLAFIVATGTDIAFLWFRRVPEGVSQTSYLYEGAGAITWASILAAGLLIFFFRRGGSVRHTVVARSLGHLLLGQTLLLALSVYVRLYNQIEIYAFTPRRIQAAELLLLGVVGLGILLFYMIRSGSFLRYVRLCIGMMGLVALCFTVRGPAALSGDLNLRFASGLPGWEFSTADFKPGCFDVRDNLTFALYVLEQEKKVYEKGEDQDQVAMGCRLMQFEEELRTAALALESRWSEWSLFTLKDAWDRRAAEIILGRPIGTPVVEPVH